MNPTDNAGLLAFHRRLHRWYGAHGRRDLPWRMTSDPYAIYVSEIMLQQTQVKTVLERYYFPFLKKFPTLALLAAAEQDEVLLAWQGLGYYNRALNLHKAAKQIVGIGGSGLGVRDKKKIAFPNPQSPIPIPDLMSLPGIGRNTAHAIAAFAYHQPVAVMEANVRRVLSRIFALESPSEAELWGKAGLLLDKESPFDYNQAMMDIGAMLCKKRTPLCRKCPASSICKGKSSPESYPAPKRKKTTPVREKHIVVLRSQSGQYYAVPRRSRFLQGMYHFIETDAGARQVEFKGRQYPFAKIKPLGHIRQQYSHFTLEADIWIINVGKVSGKDWHSYKELAKLPMSMAERKIIALLPPPPAGGGE